jgi:hypothetical protein
VDATFPVAILPITSENQMKNKMTFHSSLFAVATLALTAHVAHATTVSATSFMDASVPVEVLIGTRVSTGKQVLVIKGKHKLTGANNFCTVYTMSSSSYPLTVVGTDKADRFFSVGIWEQNWVDAQSFTNYNLSNPGCSNISLSLSDPGILPGSVILNTDISATAGGNDVVVMKADSVLTFAGDDIVVYPEGNVTLSGGFQPSVDTGIGNDRVTSFLNLTTISGGKLTVAAECIAMKWLYGSPPPSGTTVNCVSSGSFQYVTNGAVPTYANCSTVGSCSSAVGQACNSDTKQTEYVSTRCSNSF